MIIAIILSFMAGMLVAILTYQLFIIKPVLDEITIGINSILYNQKEKLCQEKKQ